jgi:hypothetical protein
MRDAAATPLESNAMLRKGDLIGSRAAGAPLHGLS